MIVPTVESGAIDPTTGATAAAGAGIYTGSANAAIPPTGRSYISWMLTPNIRIDGWDLELGGEMIFGATPAGNNRITGTVNQLSGYGARAATNATFPNRVATPLFTNTALGGSGSDVEVSVQTEVVPLTTTTIRNEVQGTNLRILGAETGNDARNFGVVRVEREINIASRDGITGTNLEGSVLYIEDTDNGARAPDAVNGQNNANDLIYIDTTNASGVLPVNQNILLGVVNVVSGAKGRGTTNDPTGTRAANPYTMDLRGIVNTLGNDTFNIHCWNAAYNYFVQTIDMSDGTTGVLTLPVNMTQDTNYSNTNFGSRTTLANLNEFYDAVKQRKASEDTTLFQQEAEDTQTASYSNTDVFGLQADNWTWKNAVTDRGTQSPTTWPDSNTITLFIGLNDGKITDALFNGITNSIAGNFPTTVRITQGTNTATYPITAITRGTAGNADNTIIDIDQDNISNEVGSPATTSQGGTAGTRFLFTYTADVNTREIVLPSISTLYATPTGTTLNIADLSPQFTTGGSSLFSVVNGTIQVNHNGSFAGGSRFDTIVSTGDITASNPVTLSNITLQVNTIDVTNLTFGEGVTASASRFINIPNEIGTLTIDGATTLDYSANAPAEIDLSGVTFTSTVANSIQINTGTTTTVLVNGSVDQDIFQGTGASTVLNIQVAATITVSWPELRGGKFWIDTISASGTRTNGIVAADGTRTLEGLQRFPDTLGDRHSFQIQVPQNATTDTIVIGIKYLSVITARAQDRRIYEEFVVERVLGSTDWAINAPLTVSDALVGNLTRPTVVNINDVGVTSGVATFELAGYTVNRINNFESQALAAIIANREDYFEAWYENRERITSPILQYGVGTAAWDPSRITFGSSETTEIITPSGNVDVRQQQLGADWSAQSGTTGTLILSRTGTPELDFRTTQGASIGTVADAARLAIETSNVARGTGYLVSETDTAGTPTTTGSRLGGIKPKSGDYNSTTTYEDIL